MLEKVPVVRCLTSVQSKINRGGDTLASCRSTGPGYLVSLTNRDGARFKIALYDADLKPAWERIIEGQLAYSGDLASSRGDVFALAKGNGYEIRWLSLKKRRDGQKRDFRAGTGRRRDRPDGSLRLRSQ
jgi:hypothetical protein